MPRFITGRENRSSPVVWFVAIVCAILLIAVIITGIVVFTVYLIYQPKKPYLKVSYAYLNKLDYDQYRTLDIEMALPIVAKNDNSRAHASFSDVSILLHFHGIEVAELRADPFDVPKNSSFALNYLVRSSAIPLDTGARDAMDAALKQGIIPFDLNGEARTRWRVGIFPPVKLWTHLSCTLKFFWPNGSVVDLDCGSKSD